MLKSFINYAKNNAKSCNVDIQCSTALTFLYMTLV